MKYSNHSNIFLAENIVEFSKCIKINNYTIKLEECKQLFFGPIYSLKLIKLKTLKIYIEINLVIGFIQPFKSSIKASIFFNWNTNRNFRLYINF